MTQLWLGHAAGLSLRLRKNRRNLAAISSQTLANTDLTDVSAAVIAELSSKDPAAVAQAEQALRVLFSHGGGQASAALVLAEAVDRYAEHRRTLVAEFLVRYRANIAWHSNSSAPIRRIVCDQEHPIHLVVRGLIRRGSLGEEPQLLWRVMAVPAWAAACRERLRGRLTRAEQEALSAASHLALSPLRDKTAVSESPAHAAAAESDGVARLLRTAREGSDGVAVAATRALALMRLAKSPERCGREEALRSIAQTAGSASFVAQLAIEYDQEAAARRTARLARDEFAESLRVSLGAGVQAQALAAIAAARCAGAVDEVLNHLEVIAREGAPRQAAAACGALGESRQERSIVTLAHAIQRADARVAANATESLARVAVRLGCFSGVREQLLGLTGDDRHRVRAAAVRALARVGDPAADSVIHAMLHDHRAAHRLAGLWVVERLARGSIYRFPNRVADLVTRLAREDRFQAVRRMAERCRRLARAEGSEIEPATPLVKFS